MLIRLRRCAGWAALLLFANPEDRFSGVEAHVLFTVYELIYSLSSRLTSLLLGIHHMTEKSVDAGQLVSTV